ncbi:Alpha/Beta hydrolase protein [Hysterangium stoloniferum]|nr:Alpha/Beta hydrolase protein [Hysterangium stoloniferum]
MQRFYLFILTTLLSISSVHSNAVPAAGPTVKLKYGTFQGVTAAGLDKFLGVRFATAGRFELPRTPAPLKGIQQAVAFGPACPQQSSVQSNPNLVTSEDCLFVNVITPAHMPAGKKLPVVFWIFGGGFEEGDTSSNDGSTVVARSMTLNEPVVYVSANYRVTAFGFAGSNEIKAAGVGNLGLRDQRFALQWVQENIHLFGGDKNRVTIWGESAGAISVGLQMVINKGNPDGLFHGAFMESGSPYVLKDMTAGQPFYDQLVANTSCSGSKDTLECLKAVPLNVFQAAVNESPSFSSFMSLQLAWQPRIDGEVITENPQDSIAKGDFSNIPFVNGDCDDEGTVFAMSTLNLTLETQIDNFIKENYIPEASDAQFATLATLYPRDPAAGSPFDTGDANQLSPEFKRIAAFEGDFVFQAPRRFFIRIASKRQNVWSFLFKRGKGTPNVGSSHESDIKEFYGSGAMPDFQGTDFLVNFINTGNPNKGATAPIFWPMYSSNELEPPLLTFLDPDVLNITTDTYRLVPMNAIIALSRELF